jgi:RNA polymerase sigma-B factor
VTVVVSEADHPHPDVGALVESHIGLAVSLAHRYGRQRDSMDDVRQAAFEGLVRAAQRFDPHRGVQFSTYATACISGHLKRHFRDTTWRVHVPRRDQERYLHVRRCTDDLAVELGASPTTEQVADRLGLSVDEVVEALAVGAVAQPSSLDGAERGAVGLGGREGLTDDRTAERIDAAERAMSLRQMIATRLDQETASIVMMSFFDGLSQSEIASRVGGTQMQVSRRLRRGLERLRPSAEAWR